MIRHLLKIVWNRRRANMLIIIEICISFVALFAITASWIYYLSNYSKPLGFDFRNVWRITLQQDEILWDVTKNELKIMDQIVYVLKDFPEIEYVGEGFPIPYENEWMVSDFKYGDKTVMLERNFVSIDLQKVFDLHVVEGRWFDKSDESAEIRPVVINQKFAEALFGSENPIDKILTSEEGDFRVVGVVDYYRMHGEFSDEMPFALAFGHKSPVSLNCVVKVKNGAGAEIEERVARKLESIAKNVIVKIDAVEDLRKLYLQKQYLPLYAGGLVEVFLLLMVGLGLTGVLWLNVYGRIREIGLRRAKGANKGHIYKQISGELFVISTIGLILGLIIIFQIPLLHLISFITTQVFVMSMLVSIGIIYLLTCLCALYPSYLAAKINPAEALHAE